MSATRGRRTLAEAGRVGACREMAAVLLAFAILIVLASLLAGVAALPLVLVAGILVTELRRL